MRFSTSSFFHDLNPSGPLINRLKYFRSHTRRCDAHRGAGLSGVMHTTESDSAVRSTPRSLTQRCDAHRGVRLGGEMHTAELFEKF